MGNLRCYIVAYKVHKILRYNKVNVILIILLSGGNKELIISCYRYNISINCWKSILEQNYKIFVYYLKKFRLYRRIARDKYSV